MASLTKDGKHLCCLSVITASWLLTAGHCTIDPYADDFRTEPTDFIVVAGSTLLTFDTAGGCVEDEVRRDVNRLVWHPDFEIVRLLNDLAMVRISRPLPYSDQIQPASLPAGPLNTRNDLPNGQYCSVAGWGSSTPRGGMETGRGPISALCKKSVDVHKVSVLHEVKLPILSTNECTKKYPWANSWLKEEEHICTLSGEGKDACNGDSGGPLLCNGAMVGLVSWGLGCANLTNPTVYTRIDHHLKWILDTTTSRMTNEASRLQTATMVITLAHFVMALTCICHA
ncbi:trypsin-like [Schistocerca gregaria]|uniref:trypsin-like n=1 Tax=Schistocerca gregaria TaxID=7010 RepID=UPI00211F1C32|nr:trypsin-like [Schistocerca gregaria]